MGTMKVTDGKGVQFTFDNGNTISIQIGPGNYGDNYNMSPSNWYDKANRVELPPSSHAEIAGWDADGQWFQINGDSVAGYVPVEAVMKFVEYLRGLSEKFRKPEIDELIAAYWQREMK